MACRRALLPVLLLAVLPLLAIPPGAHAATQWLCSPALRTDPCRSPLAATAVAAGGSTSAVRAPKAGRRRVDCFYVYPTVSTQPTLNATLAADPPVVNVAV